MTEQAYKNTDREIWRKGDGDGNGQSYYQPHISATQAGNITICVGGSCYTKSVEDWHKLADRPNPTNDDVYARLCSLQIKHGLVAFEINQLLEDMANDIVDKPSDNVLQ